jgi:cytochrome c553
VLVALVVAAGAPSVPAADVEAGRRRAEPCGACHGPTGNSSSPTVPSLAGQPAIYLHWQLILYRDGRRRDPQMSPLAAPLADTEMADLAAWYASQKPLPPPRVPLTASQAQAGRALAEQYFCFACHGTALEGREYAPRLSALSVDYLTGQLRRFKAGTRGDLDGAMTTAAQPLTEATIVEIARFIAGMPAP